MRIWLDARSFVRILVGFDEIASDSDRSRRERGTDTNGALAARCWGWRGEPQERASPRDCARLLGEPVFDDAIELVFRHPAPGVWDAVGPGHMIGAHVFHVVALPNSIDARSAVAPFGIGVVADLMARDGGDWRARRPELLASFVAGISGDRALMV